MAAEVRIWLLGGFRVGIDSLPVPDDAWRRNKAKAVVKLLALAPSHRLHREQLMDALWPELPPDAAAANLRKAVHFARQGRWAQSTCGCARRCCSSPRSGCGSTSRRSRRRRKPGTWRPRSTCTPGSCCPRTGSSPGPSGTGSSSGRASAGCCWSGRPSWRPPATREARRGRWSG